MLKFEIMPWRKIGLFGVDFLAVAMGLLIALPFFLTLAAPFVEGI